MNNIGETNKLDRLGRLGVIGMRGCEEITCRVNEHLKNFNQDTIDSNFETFVIPINCPRFGTGEAKAMILHSIRTYDIYIIMDAFNYGVTYNMYGQERPMSPDDHYQDLKRIIAAMGGKARRITVIMPMLYEGRQHKRVARESLDCAMMLQELESMGVTNIITFDAHDARVQNSIPLCGFENVHPTYQMIKACLKYDENIILNKENTMIVSPDEGAMGRCMYYSSVLGMNLGTFYKRRDYSTIVNGKNPIVAHEFLGDSVAGKDVIVIDDMISSGESMLDVAKQLKDRNANRVFVCTTFGLFTDGLEKFDEYYEKGYIHKVITTDLNYHTPELLDRPYYEPAAMGKYLASIMDTLNHDVSVEKVRSTTSKITKLLAKNREEKK